ncbi:hypothetical protein K523DRAFT_359103 [Schizophyllum commune Tattone D]|nr:hypothetical protein K523DRAFT_359103 [Schizophyllum commune Tattone D]
MDARRGAPASLGRYARQAHLWALRGERACGSLRGRAQWTLRGRSEGAPPMLSRAHLRSLEGTPADAPEDARRALPMDAPADAPAVAR